jgi:hypothetical protein
MAHHALGPSVRPRYARCPGSVAAEARYPNEESAAAAEGTLAHAVAEALLLRQEPPPCPPEMLDHAEAYAEYVRSLGDDRLVEYKVDLSPWIPDCRGTADAIVFAGRTLHVGDLKYGKGVAVDVTENEQLEAYALGAAAEFGWMGFDEIVCHIVQPRLGVFESWSFPASELESRGDRLREQAERAMAPDAPRIPGEKQCRFCRHRRHCAELAEHNFSVVTGMFKPIHEALEAPLEARVVDQISDEELPRLLPKLDLIEHWCTALRVRAYAVAVQKGIDGYKFVAGRTSRKWDNEDAVIGELKEAGVSLDDLIETRLASPAQAEKVLGKRHPVLMTHCVKNPGKPTLVPVSDKREAITHPDVSGLFENVEVQE